MSSTESPPSSGTPVTGGRPDPRWGSADVEAIVEAIERAKPRTEDLRDCPHVDEDLDIRDHMLPSPPFGSGGSPNDNALPGFGKALPDCGKEIPQAMYICKDCANVHEKRHICNRHDCPQHAPFAIRRLLVGNGDDLGVAAKFGGLIGLLSTKRDENQVPQSLFISPPQGEEWVTEAKGALDRTFDVCKKIMAQLGGEGIEGRVTYHPVRGSDGDDRGKWKNRLFKERDWIDDVAEEVHFSPHFHVRGVGFADVKSSRVVDVDALESGQEEFVERVAVRGVDYELIDGEIVPLDATLEEGEAVMQVTDIIQKRTGWSIHRREDGDGRSMHHEIPHQQRIKIAAALAYDMSHALVYTDSDGKRRLASRWKGKHVNEVTYCPLEEQQKKAAMEASRDTLGIEPPLMECQNKVEAAEDLEEEDGVPSSATTGAGGSGGRSRSTHLPRSSNVDATGEVIIGSSGPVDASSDVPTEPSSATRLTSTDDTPDGWPHDHPPGSRSPVSGRPDHVTPTERCGGELIHISEVDLELLAELDGDGVDTSDAFAAYTSYRDYMKAKILAIVGGLYNDRPPPY